MIVELLGWWTLGLVVAFAAAVLLARRLYSLGRREGYAAGYSRGAQDMGATLKASEDLATRFGHETLERAISSLEVALGARR